MAQRIEPGRTQSRRAKSTFNGRLPQASDPNAKRKPKLLDDAIVEFHRDLADDDDAMRGYWPDSKVFGLTIYLGAKSSAGASGNRAGRKAGGHRSSKRSEAGLR